MAGIDFPESPLQFGIFDHIEAREDMPSAEVYEHRMQIVEAADRAGFFGWHIAEHQGTPLSIDSSPSLMLASAIQRTQNLRMGALTFCLPWYNPLRFYNEICMLDHLSRGRIELGVGRGISLIESGFFGVGSIDESRERYREALDIFMTASRSDILNYKGKYNSYQDLDLCLHPYQAPYPPLWFPSSDKNSIEFTASHGYHTVVNTTSAEAKGLYEQYREVWVKHRNDPDRHNEHVIAPKLGKHHHVVVGDSQQEAETKGHEAHAVWSDHIGYLGRKHHAVRQTPPASAPREASARVIAGTPPAVTQELREIVETSKCNYLILVFSFGNLPPDYSLRSLELFARDVMPALSGAASG